MTDDRPVTIDSVLEQLAQRTSDASATLELLQGYREQVATEAAHLENPQAVNDYLDFFVSFVGRTIASCERIASEVSQGVTRPHIAELRQMASHSTAEQRRCLIFRDKSINKPLPDERMRPLLNEISVTTRDQLTAFRDLDTAASRLESLLPAAPVPEEPQKGFDRRALFTRIFRLPEKDS